jgi:hypothetical protein
MNVKVLNYWTITRWTLSSTKESIKAINLQIHCAKYLKHPAYLIDQPPWEDSPEDGVDGATP